MPSVTKDEVKIINATDYATLAHGETTDLKGVEIDDWQEITKDFIETMAQLVKEEIEGN